MVLSEPTNLRPGFESPEPHLYFFQIILLKLKLYLLLKWENDENTRKRGDLDCPYQRTDNGYPRYLDTIVDNVKDEVACEVQCTFYDQFVCRAFAYYSSANQCFLSGDDKGKRI